MSKTQPPSPPKKTVLPYMGKPKETEAERKRREWKPVTVTGNGVIRKRPLIREWDE
jgi:hypothetical protein